jgi:signal peptidase I
MEAKRGTAMRGLLKTCSRNRKVLVRVLLLLASGVAIRGWIWMPALVVGNSMLPTLHTGEIVGVNKLIYLFQAPQRGDVVAAWTGKELMIKRVVGLPGDQLEVRDGIFYVDGLPLMETYPHCSDHSNINRARLGSGMFVLAGDNRPQSLIAIVNRDRIVGRLVRHGVALPRAVTIQLNH